MKIRDIGCGVRNVCVAVRLDISLEFEFEFEDRGSTVDERATGMVIKERDQARLRRPRFCTDPYHFVGTILDTGSPSRRASPSDTITLADALVLEKGR